MATLKITRSSADMIASVLASPNAARPIATHASSVASEARVMKRRAELTCSNPRYTEVRRPIATTGPLVSSIDAVTPMLSARIAPVSQPASARA